MYDLIRSPVCPNSVNKYLQASAKQCMVEPKKIQTNSMMEDLSRELSRDQWAFLSVLEAFGEPVPVDVVGALAPLSPGQLLELLKKARELEWIRQTSTNVFSLGPGLEGRALKKIRKMNNRNRLKRLLRQLSELNMTDQVSRKILADLLARAGRQEEAAQLEYELAQEAMERNDTDEAVERLNRAVAHLSDQPEGPERDRLFVVATLELSNLGFAIGKRFRDISEHLRKAHLAARRLGNRRSLALIDLHLGRLYYLSERRSEAMRALSKGRVEVEKLGDKDILDQAAEFLGLYYYLQGMFQEALEYFKRAVKTTESQSGRLINPTAPIFLAYCEAYLGQFHQAIGTLDFYWRQASRKSDHSLAATIRAVLGTILLVIRKRRDASFHLHGARQEAVTANNSMALYLSEGGLAYHHFLEGRTEESREALAKTVREGADAGIVRQYSSPWFLEMLFEFQRLGLPPIPHFGFYDQVDRILKEPNAHLRGTALRLRALYRQNKGEENPAILTDLVDSEDYLKRSGDPVELAKTRLAVTRIKLSQGERAEASDLAHQAWRGLSGYAELFFPDDLRHVLGGRTDKTIVYEPHEEIIGRLLRMLEELIPSPELERLLSLTVESTNRFFSAERGGLFWFSHKKGKGPQLRAGRNLTEGDVMSESFRSSLAVIFKAYRENRPVVVRPKSDENRLIVPRTLSILCLPFEVGGRVQGVLYHDNSYLEDCFDFLDPPMLKRLAQHISGYVDRVWDYGRLREERNRWDEEKSLKMDHLDSERIVTQSQPMLRLLSQAKQVAGSDSTVLILGETGVGKELFARFLHQNSKREGRPFVVVDATTIPENLVESELFGHEKGAFTGADQQKIGRIELANQGTLFLDEVGELPQAAQAKLLRALQEKTFIRIGGTNTHSSDFRLLTATNKDLAAEVKSGRFREDLFYRLNVVPLTLPPLRERGEDIILLARHFLNHYTKKYQRPHLEFSEEDEARLLGYHWPGNVRELMNVIERSVIMSTSHRIELGLPYELNYTSKHPFDESLTLNELQRRYIRHILDKTGGRISGQGGAAELLGMKRTSLYARMRTLSLK